MTGEVYRGGEVDAGNNNTICWYICLHVTMIVGVLYRKHNN